jgi:hypothetical protein
VLTLTALLAGYLLETLKPFGQWSVYLQTGAYTATCAVSTGAPPLPTFLRRLPVGDPFVDSLDAPLGAELSLWRFLTAFIVGVLQQWVWLTTARRGRQYAFYVDYAWASWSVVTGCMVSDQPMDGVPAP